jgi:DNA-binding response OmpR family regulator
LKPLPSSILIIETEPPLFPFIDRALQESAWSVSTVRPKLPLPKAVIEWPTIILLNAALKPAETTALIWSIRAARPTVPLVALSTDERPISTDGFDAILHEPFAVDQLNMILYRLGANSLLAI